MDKFARLSITGLLFIGIALSYLLSQIYLANSAISPIWLGEGAILQYVIITASMLWAWYLTYKHPKSYDLFWLCSIGILARILLLPSEAYLSNDVARYLFDGYIAGIGLDPYSISHDAPILKDAVNLWLPPVEHLKYPTLYPPLAIFCLSLISHWGPVAALYSWKILVLIASIATLFATLKILTIKQKTHHFPLVALSPILIIESGVGLHIDTFATLMVVLAFYYFTQSKQLRSGFFIGLGALIKLFPVILLVPMLGALKDWNKSVRLILGAGITISIGYGLALWGNWQPIGSLGIFIEKFRFGSLFYEIFEPRLGFEVTGLISVIALAVGYLAIFLSLRKRATPLLSVITAVQLSIFLPFMTGPVVYPWYLMSLVPLLAIRPNKALLVWLMLQPLTYEVLSQFICCQQWQPKTWPLVIITIGLIITVLYELNKNKLVRIWAKI